MNNFLVTCATAEIPFDGALDLIAARLGILIEQGLADNQEARRAEAALAAVALGDGGLYPARQAMGGGAGCGTALDALRVGSGRCTRRGA